MKSRISLTLADCRRDGRKAFIPFITAGDPDLKTTEKLVLALAAAGATLIELGVPFSDPMADGPVIQKSSENALRKGVNLNKILTCVAQIRKKSQIPILLMGYYNPILQYGHEAFARDAVQAGVDGVLVVDLPAEEASDLRSALQGKPLDMIYLLAPTSDDKRVKLVKRYGSGFVYYVSLTGTTGATSIDLKKVVERIGSIRRQLELPIMVGFGISTPDHVRFLAKAADGVVVGSALVKLINNKGRPQELITRVNKLVQPMIKALSELESVKA